MRASLIAVLAAACGAPRPAAAPGPGPAPSVAAPVDARPATPDAAPLACADRAVALGDWLRTAAALGTADYGTARGARLVEDDDLPLTKILPAEVLWIRRDGATFGHNAIQPDDLKRGSYDEFRLLLAIEPDVPMARVAAYVDAAAVGGITDAGVLFGHAAIDPPRTAVTAQLDAAPTPVDRARTAGRLVVAVVASCPGAARLIDSMTTDPADGATIVKRFVDGFPPATTACDCALDLDQLRSLLWPAIGPMSPADRVARVSLETPLARPRDAGVAVITGATWADAAPALLASHGKRVRFAAR